MKETLLDLWGLFVVIVGGGFVLACLFDCFPPARDEPTYYWETDGYLPKYPPLPDGDEEGK